MNSLNEKQYQLSWMGEFPKFNYTSSTLMGLFSNEESVNAYLENKVLEGWVILETNLVEVK